MAAASPAAAETLAESMASAVDGNPTLGRAARSVCNATREALPQAWSEALPQISISAGADRSDRDSDNPLLESDADETWSASANVSQLLFGGGRVLASTRAARAQIAGAVADYEFARQTLLLDVTRAYADVLQGETVLAARETSVANLTRLYEYAQAQFDAGVVTRTDVAQAQARLAAGAHAAGDRRKGSTPRRRRPISAWSGARPRICRRRRRRPACRPISAPRSNNPSTPARC